eukprot:3709611-Prymnesium_polylepis.1
MPKMTLAPRAVATEPQSGASPKPPAVLRPAASTRLSATTFMDNIEPGKGYFMRQADNRNGCSMTRFCWQKSNGNASCCFLLGRDEQLPPPRPRLHLTLSSLYSRRKFAVHRVGTLGLRVTPSRQRGLA